MSTITIPVTQATVDRGLAFFAARKIRRRFRRGLYKAIGTSTYFVDVRGVLANSSNPTPAPACTCPHARLTSSSCKHIAAALLHAMSKGWL